MPVELLNPNGKNPTETHKYGIDAEIFDGNNWGTVFDRGYTYPGDKPTYAYICDDNIQRSIVESEIVDVVES